MDPRRPPFIVSSADVPERIHRHPASTEAMAPARPCSQPGPDRRAPRAGAAGQAYLLPARRVGRGGVRLRHRGEIDAGVDRELHRMKAGDLADFPPGTGICPTFKNDGEREAVLLSGGDADISTSRIYYPPNPERRKDRDMPWSRWWDDVRRPTGSHDGKPPAARTRTHSLSRPHLRGLSLPALKRRRRGRCYRAVAAGAAPFFRPGWLGGRAASLPGRGAASTSPRACPSSSLNLPTRSASSSDCPDSSAAAEEDSSELAAFCWVTWPT